MTADRIPALLEPIQNRLNAATEAAPTPWESVGTGVRGGDHWYVCAEGQRIASIACSDGGNEEHREPLARFFAGAPTDQARLLAAVQAVTALHRPERGIVHDPDDGETKEMDYCETCSDSQWLDEATAVAYPCPTVAAVVAALGGEA